MTTSEKIIERVRHELKFRLVRVVSNERITPNMARIVVASDDLAGFTSLAYDDHVKLFFPENGETLKAPQPGPNGLVFPEGTKRPEARDYTPRAFDPATNQLTLDFVIHGDGIATSWAASAKPGDQIGVGGPRGSFVVRAGFDWYLLVGDETALPAIGRRIEELPQGAKIIAFVEVADTAERQDFDTEADLEMHWIARNGVMPGRLDLLSQAVRAASLPDAAGGYAFVAGEAAMSKQVREILIVEHGFGEDRVKAAGYWRSGEADFDDGHAH